MNQGTSLMKILLDAPPSYLLKDDETKKDELIQKCRKCIEEGANVKDNSPYRNNPLLIAIELDLYELVELFLDHGMPVNWSENNGYGPISMAAEKGRIKPSYLLSAVQMLI